MPPVYLTIDATENCYCKRPLLLTHTNKRLDTQSIPLFHTLPPGKWSHAKEEQNELSKPRNETKRQSSEKSTLQVFSEDHSVCFRCTKGTKFLW